jgi:hypothetical protein
MRKARISMIARTESRACPSGGRHEHRHRDQVDGDTGGEIERRFAEIARDRRQRRRDDRAVQRLHEERCRDDERDAAGEGSRSAVGRGLACRCGVSEHGLFLGPSRENRHDVIDDER